jgi:hypothetical protein
MMGNVLTLMSGVCSASVCINEDLNTFIISLCKLDDVHILESIPSVENWSNGELISKEVDDVAMEAVAMMEVA